MALSKVLGDWKLGTEGEIKAELVDGNVVAAIKYDGQDLAGEFDLTIKTKAGLEALKALIPGTLDDMIISVLEAALGM